MATEESLATPYFSVIIPARNEEAHLPTCLQSIARAAERARKSYEIIVVANRCTDLTEAIARSAGCNVVHDDTKNLSHIRNTGARMARGEILVTIDADSRMSPAMLGQIAQAISVDEIVGGGVMIVPERLSLGILLTGLLLVPIILRHRIAGGVFFSRRSDFLEIGGFDEGRSSAEDIDFAKRLKAHGRRTGRCFKTLWFSWIVTSCRKFDTLGDWYFLRRPFMTLRLLRGVDQEAANTVWYDFPRE